MQQAASVSLLSEIWLLEKPWKDGWHGMSALAVGMCPKPMVPDK